VVFEERLKLVFRELVDIAELVVDWSEQLAGRIQRVRTQGLEGACAETYGDPFASVIDQVRQASLLERVTELDEPVWSALDEWLAEQVGYLCWQRKDFVDDKNDYVLEVESVNDFCATHCTVDENQRRVCPPFPTLIARETINDLS
jgi:hypothetical protein